MHVQYHKKRLFDTEIFSSNHKTILFSMNAGHALPPLPPALGGGLKFLEKSLLGGGGGGVRNFFFFLGGGGVGLNKFKGGPKI